MSHEITEFDKQQGIEMAWHQLTDVKPDLSLDNCWLSTWDYRPERLRTESGAPTQFYRLGVTDEAIVTKDENGNLMDEANFYPLTIGTPYNSDSFKPLLNSKINDLLLRGTKGKDMLLASCGTVKARGRQFWSFQVGEKYSAGGRDFLPFYNIGNGNDKSSPLWQNISNTCTVCNNTFQQNMLQAGLIMEVKKTKYSDLQIGDFSAAMKAMLTGQQTFAKEFDALAMTKISEDDARAFFAGFAADPEKAMGTRSINTVERLLQLFKGGAGNEGKNLADVFSAITDFYTHEAASGKGDMEANWKNFVSSEFGSSRNKKQEAWIILNTPKTFKGLVGIGRKIVKLTIEAEKARKVQAEIEEKAIADALASVRS